MSANFSAVFEERAENLTPSDLKDLSAPLPHDSDILKKLKGGGAKLLSGPRGSGKSTLLRRAYFDLLHSSHTLPVYVNYAKSLSLEPLLHTNASAIPIFRQWLLCKIVLGIHEAFLADQKSPPHTLTTAAGQSVAFIGALEAGIPQFDRDTPLAVSSLILSIEQWCKSIGRQNCVLLLDDAAHAFSAIQQQEFFELFRQLKTPFLSAKAAVYPGVTAYSHNFHLGHDAESIEVWTSPDDPTYLKTMRQLFNKRIPSELARLLNGREELIDFLALASFGIPRAFLNLLAQLLDVDDMNRRVPNSDDAKRAVESLTESVEGLFFSLSTKLPRYKRFVDLGRRLELAIANNLKQHNQGRDLDKKSTAIALGEPIEGQAGKILGLMEYAGLIRKSGSFNSGDRGRYQRYILHYSIVLSSNALMLGRFGSIVNTIAALRSRDSHSIAYSRISSLLGADYIAECTLDLPPCKNCGEPRLVEEARFCMSCGHQLSDASIYHELLKASIYRLPITPLKVERILDSTNLRCVQDIMLDTDSVQLRRAKSIGPVWAKRIHNAAEEYVSV